QGGPYFDQLELVRNFDPRYISLHYDTSHWLQVSQSNMAAMIMMGGPYIGGFVWKDGDVVKRDPAEVAAAGAGAPGGGGGFAGGAAGASGGRGGGRGGGGRGGPAYNGWTTRQLPVGTGMVDFSVAARALKAINFDGPTECQPEWAGLGGAENGRDTITVPRETV